MMMIKKTKIRKMVWIYMGFKQKNQRKKMKKNMVMILIMMDLKMIVI